jgi:hypothetical protein
MEQAAAWKTHRGLWYWTFGLVLLTALMIFNYTHRTQVDDEYAEEEEVRALMKAKVQREEDPLIHERSEAI